MSDKPQAARGGQWDYVFVKGEGNKGASYKYQWKPEMRFPPGVNQTRVFLGLVGILGLSAIPIYVLPYLSGTQGQPRENHYAAQKRRLRETRDQWIASDDMPYK